VRISYLTGELGCSRIVKIVRSEIRENDERQEMGRTRYPETTNGMEVENIIMSSNTSWLGLGSVDFGLAASVG
jgi:hypothetical protein